MVIAHDENGLVIDGYRLMPNEIPGLMRLVNRYYESMTGWPQIRIREDRTLTHEEIAELAAYLNNIQVIPA